MFDGRKSGRSASRKSGRLTRATCFCRRRVRRYNEWIPLSLSLRERKINISRKNQQKERKIDWRCFLIIDCHFLLFKSTIDFFSLCLQSKEEVSEALHAMVEARLVHQARPTHYPPRFLGLLTSLFGLIHQARPVYLFSGEYRSASLIRPPPPRRTLQ